MYNFIHSVYGIVTINALIILIAVIVYNAIKVAEMQKEIKTNVEDMFKDFSMVFPLKKKSDIGPNQYKNFILLSALSKNNIDVYKIVDKECPYKKVTITIKNGYEKKFLNQMNKYLSSFFEKYFTYDEIVKIVNNNRQIACELLESLNIIVEDYTNTISFNAGDLLLTQVADVVQLSLNNEYAFISDNTYAYQTLTNAKKKKKQVTVHWNKDTKPMFIDQFAIQLDK